MRAEMRTENDVRAALGAKIGGPVSPAIWDRLVKDRYVQEVLDGYPDAFANLCKRYKQLEEIKKEPGKKKTAKSARRREWSLPPDRLMLLRSRLLAQIASDFPLVRWFRRQYLPDGLPLLWDDVPDWIAHQAAVDGPPSTWVEFVLPPGHRLEYDQEGRVYRVTPPLESIPVTGAHRQFLDFIRPDRPDEVQSVPVAAGGVLDALRKTSEWLAAEMGWTKAQATVFVLTDRPPVFSPLSISVQAVFGAVTTARIVISADPECQPGTVERLYQRVRAGLGKRRPHPLAPWVADLVEFVLDSPRLTWQERWQKWNCEHPDHQYTCLQSMTNAYYRAVGKLLPDYSLFGSST